MFEGDSWMHYPPNNGKNQDLFTSLDNKLDDLSFLHYNTYQRAAFQHFGDTSAQMFDNPSPDYRRASDDHTQFFYTKKYLDAYAFNLVVLSSGGNDIGDPGIAPSADSKDDIASYKDDIVDLSGLPLTSPYYILRCYDPYKAAGINDSTTAPDTTNGNHINILPRDAGYWIERSFPALLKNHLWSLYLTGRVKIDQIKESNLNGVNNIFDVRIAALINQISPNPNLPGPDLRRLETDLAFATGQAIAIFPDPNNESENRVDFPVCALVNSAANDLLDIIFDRDSFQRRFNSIHDNIDKFLIYAGQTQDQSKIVVLAHTYCYAMFMEQQTIFHNRRKGPWLHNRLVQSNITHRFAQSAAIKYMIDYFLWKVLKPLQAKYGFFFYVDLRQLSQQLSSWADEIHLTAAGFETVASEVFGKITAKFATEIKASGQ